MVKSVLGVLVCHLGSITAAFGRLVSFRLPNRGDIVPSGVLGVCFPSLCHHRFRSPPFVRRPNRGDLVSFGFVQRVPPLYHRRFRPPPFRLSNRGYILSLVEFVLY